MPSIPPSTAQAFAYRPYTTTSEATQLNRRLFDWDSSDDDKTPSARIVSRQQPLATTIRTTQSLDRDRAHMAQLQTSSMTARIGAAKRILDDVKFEYSCDVLYECQRG
ncbi:hypothetical protein LPJ81_006830, partial [Coemansia sp. IMI 209127]